jgi:MFS family permease
VRANTAGVSSEARTHTTPLQLFNIAVLWFAINFWWAGVLAILLPVFVAGIAGEGLKGTYVFFIGATGAALSSLVQLVIGPVSDRTTGRYGRRTPYMFVGVMLALPAIYLFFRAPDVSSFALLLLAYGWIQIWLNIGSGPYQAIIPDLVPDNRQGVAAAFMGMMLLLGNAAGLLAIFHWRENLIVVCYIAVALLAASAIYTCVTTGEPPRYDNPLGRFRLSETFRIPLRRYPDFTWLMASRFFINLAFYTALPFLLYYLKDALGSDAPTADMGKLSLIATFSGVAGNWPSGWLSDRISKKAIVYFTCVLMTIASVFFVFNTSLNAAFLIAALFGTSWGAFAAVDWAFACNLVPKKEEGRYMAVWHLAFTVPQVIAPWVGPLADWANRSYPQMPGIGWRLALALIPFYLAIGAWAIRHVREPRVQPTGPTP